MFKIACGALTVNGWAMPPSEFWNMTPTEWWAIYDYNIGEDIKDKRDTMNNLLAVFKKRKQKQKALDK